MAKNVSAKLAICRLQWIMTLNTNNDKVCIRKAGSFDKRSDFNVFLHVFNVSKLLEGWRLSLFK